MSRVIWKFTSILWESKVCSMIIVEIGAAVLLVGDFKGVDIIGFRDLYVGTSFALALIT